MSAIAAWWALPIVATLLAMVWVAWANRTRGPGDVSQTTKDYAKFRAAMEPSGQEDAPTRALRGRRSARREQSSTTSADGVPSS